MNILERISTLRGKVGEVSFRSQNITDLVTIIRDDARDTMDKINQNFETWADVLLSDINDIITIDSTIINEKFGTAQLITTDGDVIKTDIDNDGNIVNIVTGIDGQSEETSVIAYKTEDGYQLSDHAIHDISGQHTWTPAEIVRSMTDTYTCNDVVERACVLIQNGEYSVTNFAAKCSDIVNDLQGDARDLYNQIITSVDSQNPNTFFNITSMLYKRFTDSVTTSNTIEFADNDYGVDGFCGTFIMQAITTAAQAVGMILIAAGEVIGKVVGLVITGLGYIGQWIGNYISNKYQSEGTINPESMLRLYAQPILQKKSTDTGIQLPTNLEAAIRTFGTFKVVQPHISWFFWVDGKDLATDPINIECFLNTTMSNNTPDINGYLAHTANYRSNVGDYQIHTRPRTLYSNDVSLHALYNIGNDESDATVRKRLAQALACLGVDHYSTNNLTGYDDIYMVESTVGISDINHSLGTAIIACSNATNASTIFNTYFTWEHIVNDIVPQIQNMYASGVNNLLRVIEDLLFNTEVDAIIGAQKCVSVYYEFSVKNDFYLVPPSYTPNALLLGIIVGAAIIVASTAIALAIRFKVRKWVRKKMASQYATVAAAQETFQNEQTEENFNNYYKSVKKYNRWAFVTGSSSISYVQGWETGEISSSTATDGISALYKKSDESQLDITEIINLIK